MAGQVTFFSADQTGNTTSSGIPFPFRGGEAQFTYNGVPGTAAAQLQFSSDNGTTWKNCTGVQISSSAPTVAVRESYGNLNRVVITGAGGTSWNLLLQEVRVGS